MIRAILRGLRAIFISPPSKSIDDDFDDLEYLPMEFKLTVVERPSRDKLKIRNKKWK